MLCKCRNAGAKDYQGCLGEVAQDGGHRVEGVELVLHIIRETLDGAKVLNHLACFGLFIWWGSYLSLSF